MTRGSSRRMSPARHVACDAPFRAATVDSLAHSQHVYVVTVHSHRLPPRIKEQRLLRLQVEGRPLPCLHTAVLHQHVLP